MMANELRLFRIALQFLTQLTVGSFDTCPADWLPRSAKYMPLVGVLVGAISGASIIGATLFFPHPLPVVIGVLVAVALTRALHEDGLADTVDAFGGGRTRESRLEIMKDSRIGIFGALVLIAVLALKASALVSIDPTSAACVLIAAHAGARLAMVLAMWRLPHAGGGNTKVSHKTSEMTNSEIAVAAALGLLPGLVVLQSATFVIAALCAFGAAATMASIARQKIGGYTGDVLGAVEQIYETVFIVFAAALISRPG